MSDNPPPASTSSRSVNPPADPRNWGSPPREHHVPRRTGDVGMMLFLASLVMLFAASMVGYVIIRVMKTRDIIDPGSNTVAFPATAPPLGSIHMPAGLWFSTLVILASSFTMHRALRSVQHERQAPFRRWLIATLLLSILFLLVQLPSMGMLLFEHVQAEMTHTMLGLIFTLILLHGLHVIGGMIPLAVVTYKAAQDRYDHEHYSPVRYVTQYWHFLDVVWIVMFLTLLVTG